MCKTVMLAANIEFAASCQLTAPKCITFVVCRTLPQIPLGAYGIPENLRSTDVPLEGSFCFQTCNILEVGQRKE